MYYSWSIALSYFFFFNDPATTEIYTYGHTLSLHDALPIFPCWSAIRAWSGPRLAVERIAREFADAAQRADQLRRLDREENGLAVRAGREQADRLDIFLGDEIVNRLRIAAGEGVGHHLGRLGLCLRRTLARLRVPEPRFPAALPPQYPALPP